jgi:hypothetical protein
MHDLQESIIPVAEALLGKESRNLLIPLWRRLSAALENKPYDAGQPELHPSYAAAQAMDWDTVRRTVEMVPGWQADPVLLIRHANASERLHRKSDALLSWFHLCWEFPEQGDALESSGDNEIRQLWMAFLELEPELPTETFPAWALIQKPGFARILQEPTASAAACSGGYRVLYDLQTMVPGDNNQDRTIELRARLQQQDPLLFQQYINAVKV